MQDAKCVVLQGAKQNEFDRDSGHAISVLEEIRPAHTDKNLSEALWRWRQPRNPKLKCLLTTGALGGG